jgi:opacity protein-like surface antigen
MKRGILCLVLAAFFALPALAAAEVNGVYIAPRFLVGIQDSGSISTSDGFSDAFSQHSQAVFGGALAVGYNFAPKFKLPIRAELEYALRSNSQNKKDGSFDDGGPVNWETKHTLNISTLFVNAYFDFNTGTAFTPYIGAGAGMAFNYTGAKGEVSVPGAGAVSLSADQYDTTFAWNVGAGLSYAFTENIAADLGYRFVSTGYREVEKMGIKVGSAPYIHEFYLGARFTF